MATSEASTQTPVAGSTPTGEPKVLAHELLADAMAQLGAMPESADRRDAESGGTPAPSGAGRMRVALDERSVKDGLGKLVLTLVKLLHELLERQALRRMDAGSLTDEQVEKVGDTLMRQAQEIRRLAAEMGVSEEELNMDLGPLGRLL